MICNAVVINSMLCFQCKWEEPLLLADNNDDVAKCCQNLRVCVGCLLKT